MPTLEQIKQYMPQTPPKPKLTKKIFKIVVGFILAWLIYIHFISAKIMNMPDHNNAQSYFKELFDTPHKKVVWFGPDCPMGRHRKSVIDNMMKKAQLDQYFQHIPFLQNSLSLNSSDKLGHFIVQNCSENICIINPVLNKVVQTNEQNFISDMNKYVYDENWKNIRGF